jgi:hypothetical protein
MESATGGYGTTPHLFNTSDVGDGKSNTAIAIPAVPMRSAMFPDLEKEKAVNRDSLARIVSLWAMSSSSKRTMTIRLSPTTTQGWRYDHI